MSDVLKTTLPGPGIRLSDTCCGCGTDFPIADLKAAAVAASYQGTPRCANCIALFQEAESDRSVKAAEVETNPLHRYEVIWTQSLDDLQKDVSRALAKGWELHGALVVFTIGSELNPCYVQALTRPKEIAENDSADEKIRKAQK
jgi:hypothetical protein